MNLDNFKNTFSTNQSDRIYTIEECIEEFTNPNATQSHLTDCFSTCIYIKRKKYGATRMNIG